MKVELVLSCLMLVAVQVRAGVKVNVNGKMCADIQDTLDVPQRQPAGLYRHCSQHRKLACCSNATAYEWHKHVPHGQFNYHHCKDLSPECRKHFSKDACFRYCSPDHAELWFSLEDNRPRHIPLCARDCNRWFKACKNDMTCARDWRVGLEFSTGMAMCPEGAECKTYSEMYESAKDFCETIFKGYYNVVTDDQPCMKFTFNANNNPNGKVADYYRNLRNDKEEN